jgi:hypothetical protein
MGKKETLEERLERYLKITEKALAKVSVAPPNRSFLRRGGEDFLSMAQSYLHDAQHFKEQGDVARALAAVSYAHGWIDAGVRLGLLDGGNDDQTFTQYT